MSTPIVRAKLQLDNDASSELKKVKGDFAETATAAKSAQGAATEFAKSAAGAFVGMNLKPAIDEVYEFGKSFVMAATAGDAGDTAVAAMISTVQGLQWGTAKAQAQGFGDELDEIAVRAGIANEDVGNAFQAMIELRGATEGGLDAALDDVAKISTIASTLGKSAEGLGRELSFMQDGVVKTKGQLYQLLETTGIFGNSTKKAAAYWASLTEESRISALNYGMSKIADSMERADPSAQQLMRSVEDLYEQTKEKLGEPLMNELIPVLSEVSKEWVHAIPDIEKFAKAMSREIAGGAKATLAEAKEAFKYLVDHHEEIRAAIADGVAKAKAVVEFILAHKEEIAIAFGAKALAPQLGTAASAAGKALDFSAKGGMGIAGTGGGAVMAGAVVVSFAAAVAAWALATDQWGKLMNETGGGKSEAEQDQAARKTRFEAMIAAPSVGEMSPAELKGFDDLKSAYVKGAAALGEDSRAAGELADKAYAAHKTLHDIVAPMEGAGAAIEKLSLAAEFFPEQADEMAQQTDAQVAAIAGAFTKASDIHNEAAQQFIADLLGKSKETQKAFLMSADLTAEGFSALADLVQGTSGEFADKLREIGGAKSKGNAASPAAPNVQIANATFNIKQDFRDQDPDRVFVTFEADVIKSAERRLQSGMSLPFGG